MLTLALQLSMMLTFLASNYLKVRVVILFRLALLMVRWFFVLTNIKHFVLVTSFWSDWTIWSNCSAFCDTGTETRTRTCELAVLGPCDGYNYEEQDCFIISCHKFYTGKHCFTNLSN